jgi:hypothetical protein
LLRHWLPWLVLGVAGGLALGLLVRPWQLRWGATPEEAAAALAGDDPVPGAWYVTTRAVTVRASPERVWPSLVQMRRVVEAREAR